MSINEVQDEVIAEFNDFDDWMDRYQLLIDLGNEQDYFTAHQSALRTYTGRDSECRPLLYR